MTKKIRNIIIWSIIVLYLVLVLVFVSSRYNKIQCNDIQVEILDSATNRLVQKDDVIRLIYEYSDGDVIGYSFKNINTQQLETKLNNHPYFEHAEVFKTIKGILEVKITQRTPIIRVFTDTNQSFYIDKNGYIMPVSVNYSSYEIVATGNIKLSFNLDSIKKLNNINEFKETNTILFDLFTLSKYIKDDPFYLSQIVQIFINEDNEFELIPRVGEQIIYFGSIENYEEKFINLKEFYKNGINRTGWNKYKSINLKYKNQIVCAY